MVDITSPQNPLIKRIRSLKQRKCRRREECFWAEGLRIALEALESGWDIEALVWAPELLRSDLARRVVAQTQVRSVAVSSKVFRRLSDRDHPQGLGILARIPKQDLQGLSVGPEALLIVLEEARDPGNVGSVVRTADCVGGSGVILLGSCADPYDPQAVRASMGSLFALPVVSDVGIPEFVNWAKRWGLWLLGTSASAGLSYREAAYRQPVALLFGSEREGMSDLLRIDANQVVRIPIFGRASSLNLSSAVAVIACHARLEIESAAGQGR